jgi:hypothetical protein
VLTFLVALAATKTTHAQYLLPQQVASK